MSIGQFLNRIRLGFQQLEGREVPTVGISLSAGVLTISGDSWNNSALVSLVNNKVNVRVESTPTSGFILTPSVKTGAYTGVSQIKFFGSDGNDVFDSTFIYPCYVDGGAGNDNLEGGGSSDTIFGGTGNDTLRGVGGDDNLYGGDGSDKLYGGNGRDGLYGGAGTDELFGGNDADRFLVVSGFAEQKDATSSDAIMVFRNNVQNWTTSEIIAVDGGLSRLHQRTGNDNLLETSSGGTVTFWRGGANGTILADNNSAGRVNVYNAAFKNASFTAATIIHEMAHNLDTEHNFSPTYTFAKWETLSGWRKTAPPASTASSYFRSGDSSQFYLKNATFALNYGKTNSKEDFATAWESYFTTKYRLADTQGLRALSTAKFNYLDGLFNRLS